MFTSGAKQTKSGSERESFIRRAHEARLARDYERRQERAATLISAYYRSYVVRKRLRQDIVTDIKIKLGNSTKESIENPQHHVSANETHELMRRYMFLTKRHDHLCEAEMLDLMCRHVISTVKSSEQDTAINYLAYHFCSTEPVNADVIKTTKRLLQHCCDSLKKLRLSSPVDSELCGLYLEFIILITSSEDWNDPKQKIETKDNCQRICDQFIGHLVDDNDLFRALNVLLSTGLCAPRPILKVEQLDMIIKLSLRPLLLRSFSSSMIHEFGRHMLTVPGLVTHLEQSHALNSLEALQTHSLLAHILDTLTPEQNSRIFINTLDAIQALFIMGNVVHLASRDTNETLKNRRIDFVILVTRLLECCQKYVLIKQSSLAHWHPILGWFSTRLDPHVQDSMGIVKNQLNHLWSMKMLQILFADLVTTNNRDNLSTGPGNKLASSNSSNKLSLLVQRHCNIDSPSFGRVSSNSPSIGNLLRRVVERAASSVGRSLPTVPLGNHKSLDRFNRQVSTTANPLASQLATNIGLVCNLYQLCLTTLSQMKLDILVGLCLHDFILPHLWKFIASLGPHNGLRVYLDYVALTGPKTSAYGLQILILFCRCATHLISILDDIEVYDQQRPFCISELVSISGFLNQFVYRIIWNNLVLVYHHAPVSGAVRNSSTPGTHNEFNCKDNANQIDPLVDATHTLLTVLYKRDCRRQFAPPDHWLIKDIKVSSFVKDVEQNKAPASIVMQKMPHVLPHKERVLLFRRHANNEKNLLGLNNALFLGLSGGGNSGNNDSSGMTIPTSTLITVHRSRVIEDGYQQLIRLSPKALKGQIRVKFINDQGLDEAGIDQNGVFKEFLEDTIKRVFDPTLNLFSVTSEQRLYPSPTSHVHEDHLSLFEFVGKMLGKAVYEGIVVDVPFASFFLSQVLGQPLHNALYSSIDELPSLDPELYKSLTYIKHYDGDVSELDLTFSIDQDVMGKIVTYELEQGGKSKPVTRDTRVSYIHLVAHFRMHTQIHEQTGAFIRGFRSIINPDWLAMFSTVEFQRLISGDNIPIDLDDLRRHTKYLGGFHNNHRVINWLWDILSKDFSAEELRLFLKFVTSCSKAPLLGFANLEPPFSIRCVEVSDDQDLGDTVGSILRGFFAIRHSDPVDRLPTSSTCFNLLKLPNYQRRSTLRDKLRYAINSNPGFELS